MTSSHDRDERELKPRASARLRAGVVALLLGVPGGAGGALALLLALEPAPGALPVSWPGAISGALGALPEVMAAVLGLSLTVVAIVVQLAGQRYPAKIVDLFMTDARNVMFFGFITTSCVYMVAASVLTGTDPSPTLVSAGAIVLALLNFCLLLPYFGHVFAFLEPNNIITRIRARADSALKRACRRELSPERLTGERWRVANAIDRIADNAMAAASQSDRNLAMHSVRTLEALTLDYLAIKRALPQAWATSEAISMSTLAKDFLDEILEHNAWVEAKILMEYERIFRLSLGQMTELVSQLAASTRAIGESAMTHDQGYVLDLSVQFFNTYLRHTLNQRNVRAAYNVMYEYRRFAHQMLTRGHPDTCLRVVEHMVYYGRTANAMGLPFVTVTVANDVRVLCQDAFTQGQRADMRQMLALLLSLDQASETDGQEVALLGVRRAQSILGAFLLSKGASDDAQAIRDDMSDEPARRLLLARDAILAVRERKFWEVTDRGFNFDYVEPALRSHIDDFFAPLLHERAD